jgi:hypothetical protein
MQRDLFEHILQPDRCGEAGGTADDTEAVAPHPGGGEHSSTAPGGHPRGNASAAPAATAAAAKARRIAQEVLVACRKRLRAEWRRLNDTYLGGRLRPPSIELDAATSRWGSWNQTTRTITLAVRLVTRFRWGSVVETLKHEMAHQVVSEIFFAEGGRPHGDAFRKACGLLSVSPRASDDGGIPLERPVRSEDPSDRRLRKIRSLLALADSPNVHEAEAALAKANHLLLKYNLSLVDAEVDRSYAVRQLGRPLRRRTKALKILAGILSAHFFVEAIWVDSYDALAMTEGRVLEIVGTADNLELAEFVFAELQRSANGLWRRHAMESASPQRNRRQFEEGVLVGFSNRLDQERRRAETEHALVWTGDPALDAYFRRRHPRVQTEAVAIGGTAAYEAGREEGARLHLRRALKAQSRNRGRLLAAK